MPHHVRFIEQMMTTLSSIVSKNKVVGETLKNV